MTRADIFHAAAVLHTIFSIKEDILEVHQSVQAETTAGAGKCMCTRTFPHISDVHGQPHELFFFS